MNAETAYLFRHALLRDAAYQLQLPGARARLHLLALQVLEKLSGGPAPEAPAWSTDRAKMQSHASDVIAQELAEHALAAQDDLQLNERDREELRSTALRYLRRAAHYAEESHWLGPAAQLWAKVASLCPASERAVALGNCAFNLDCDGRSLEALPVFETARRLMEAESLQRYLSYLLIDYGAALQNLSRMDRAREMYLAAREHAVRIGDKRCEVKARGSLAGVDLETGRISEAASELDSLLRECNDINDKYAAAVTLANLAVVEATQNKLDAALEHIEAAMTLYQGLGLNAKVATANARRAGIYASQGKVLLAIQTYERAVAELRQLGHRREVGAMRGNLAIELEHIGRSNDAERAYVESLAISREVGDLRSAGVVLKNLGNFHRDHGAFEKAIASYEEALSISRQVANRRFEGLTMCDYSLLKLLMRDLVAARQTWREGAAVLDALGAHADVKRKTNSMRAACAKAEVVPFDAA